MSTEQNILLHQLEQESKIIQTFSGVKSKNIFITGAGGALGTRVVELLHNQGHKLRVLALAGVDISQNFPPGVEVVWGNLCEPHSYAHALEGVQAVLHMAALILSNHKEQFFKVNVEGTGHLLKICQQNSVEHFVLISSASVAYKNHTAYAQSKVAAEQLVCTSNMNWSIVRPTLLVGSGGGREYQIFRKYCQFWGKTGFLPLPGGGGARKQPILVADVAGALAQLFANPLAPKAGKTYFLAGPKEHTLAEMGRALVGKRKVRIVHLPFFPLSCVARMADALSLGNWLWIQALTGLREDAVFSLQAARDDLQFTPREVLPFLKQGE